MDHRSNIDVLSRSRRALHDSANASGSHFWSSDEDDGDNDYDDIHHESEISRDGLSQSERGFRTKSYLASAAEASASSVAAAAAASLGLPTNGVEAFASSQSFRGPPRLQRYRRRRQRDEPFAQTNADGNDGARNTNTVDGFSGMDEAEWSLPSDSADDHRQSHSTAVPLPLAANAPRRLPQLTEHDIAMCQALDLDYERALEDRQVAWTARYQSVRQATLASIATMVLLILAGTTVFLHQADSYWSISEGLLFSIYTITTVGYGHLDMPSTAVFQIYVILYIFLGIAMLTILLAQVYQCLALEASRVVTDAGDAQARRNTMRVWLEARTRQQQNAAAVMANANPDDTHNPTARKNQDQNQFDTNQNADAPTYTGTLDDPVYTSVWDWADVAVCLLDKWDRLRNFLRYNEFGRGVSVVLPFGVLIALGAGVIGPLEGWSPIEATYFAVVSLTTVGFGDYYPTQTASIWFCCLWLPFSVGFMSLYLANVAAFYIRISDRNVARIGRILRKRLQAAKERAEQERRAILKRALRGQYNRRSGGGDGGGTSQSDAVVDELAVATQAAEAAQRPLVEVLEGITVITVDLNHGISGSSSSNNGGLRQAAHRMRGFDTIPTLDDTNPSADSTETSAVQHYAERADVESPRRQHSIARSDEGASPNSFRQNGPVSYQRQRILQNSLKHMELVSKSKGAIHTAGKGKLRATMTMKTMKDVLGAVHRNNKLNGNTDTSSHGGNNERMDTSGNSHRDELRIFQAAGDESEFLSVRSSRTVLHHDRKTVRKKPSFALRVLVQERFAEIIAADVAGFQSSIEIKEFTLAVTIDSLKDTAEKWLLPRRARKAFRAVAFEALYFVGEHGLITRGSEALYSLTPFEFHELFSPLLAAFGDAETMELWLERTQALSEVDLSTSTGSHIAQNTSNAPRRANKAMQAPHQKEFAHVPVAVKDFAGMISPQTEVTYPSTASTSPRASEAEMELPDIT